MINLVSEILQHVRELKLRQNISFLLLARLNIIFLNGKHEHRCQEDLKPVNTVINYL